MNEATEASSTTLVKTLVVDDAPMMRKVIQQILTKDEQINVVGTATNGQECLERILELKPDVVTLDIDMPVMNGLTAIKNIMVRYQIPIVIISSLIQDGYFAFEALRLGVVDFVPKPSRVATASWADEEELVRMRVRLAASMQVNRMRRVRRRKKAAASASPTNSVPTALVVMGTTLAGPNTIMHIVTQLSPDFPGAIVAVQEIHPRILAPFCTCFNDISPLEVVPVNGPCALRPGKVYLASTFKGLQMERAEETDEIILDVTDSVEMPIDQLFSAATTHFQQNTCGVLLTGVGMDGAEGLGRIQASGGLTIGQEQDCCVYPNLVENALRNQVVDVVMSNQGIASRLETWIQGKV
jgi:two-component system, chemotaxis family, protein-glutamate methylesterase/glutaminase